MNDASEPGAARPLRIAFVVQRYGAEVNGGAELHCRMLAERLARRDDVQSVTVLTTCAKDYESWRNEYPAGNSQLNGVQVERFETRLPRQGWLQDIASYAGTLGLAQHALDRLWLWSQGPVAPGLLRRLAEVASQHDVFVFFTYLYHPTVHGLPLVPGKRLLIPTAHDEPAIRRSVFRAVFELPEAIAFNSVEERELVQRRFAVDLARTDVVGCGVDEPPLVSGAPARERPYVLYLGRLAEPKGVATLATQFLEFRRRQADTRFESAQGSYLGRELELVFAGSGDRSLVPTHERLVLEGFVSDERRHELLAGAQVLAMPSRFESLSLVTLEAFMARVPVLVERECEVTAGHVARSDGGLAYHGVDELCAQLATLLSSRANRRRLAENGHRYVNATYAWPVVEQRLMKLIGRVAQAGAA
ncbi:MAG TPA: glycosyltransferase family 4 protein [Polyangiaceae bacterium]|nr:glycosyltransferase family 4 protein [Polyangiaceae bacterium]